ncbi:hypothetical protein NC652_027852 [Populus alba x Populus x berolinensis]|nr:hypothetical protein NC652_027852 [Populus alba x Populus x berolinensis]
MMKKKMLITKMIVVTMMDVMKQIWREICYCENEGQVIELLHSLGKSERGLAITCLKSILCRTGKRVCLVCKDFLIQNMDSTTLYFEPLSVRKLIVLVSLFFIVIY